MSELRAAVWRATQGYKGGIEAIAKQLSTAHHTVNAQILRNQVSGNLRHNLSIATAESIVDLCNSDELAHAAAQQRGGVFIKLPEDGVHASDLAVLELVTQVWRANGDVGLAVDETLADGKVESAEIAKVRKAIYRTQQAMSAMLHRLEDMAG